MQVTRKWSWVTRGRKVPQSKPIGREDLMGSTGWKWDGGKQILRYFHKENGTVWKITITAIFRDTVRKQPYFTPIKGLGRGAHFGGITWFIPLKCQNLFTKTYGAITTKTSLNVERVHVFMFSWLHLMRNFVSLPGTIRKAINIVKNLPQTLSAVKMDDTNWSKWILLSSGIRHSAVWYISKEPGVSTFMIP